MYIYTRHRHRHKTQENVLKCQGSAIEKADLQSALQNVAVKSATSNRPKVTWAEVVGGVSSLSEKRKLKKKTAPEREKSQLSVLNHKIQNTPGK